MDRQGYCCCFRVTYSKSIFVLQLWTCWTRCWPLTLTRGSRWRRRWHTPTWNNTTTPQMRWVRHLVLYGSPGFKKTAQLLLFYKMIEEQISSFNSRSSAEVLNCFSRCCIPYAVFYIYIYKYWVLHFQRLMFSSGLILNMRFKDNDGSEDRQRVNVRLKV